MAKNHWIKFEATATSKCPVPSGTVVDIVFDDGQMHSGYRAYDWSWKNDLEGTIVKFRKAHAAKKSDKLAVKIDVSGTKELNDKIMDAVDKTASEYVSELTQPLPEKGPQFKVGDKVRITVDYPCMAELRIGDVVDVLSLHGNASIMVSGGWSVPYIFCELVTDAPEKTYSKFDMAKAKEIAFNHGCLVTEKQENSSWLDGFSCGWIVMAVLVVFIKWMIS